MDQNLQSGTNPPDVNRPENMIVGSPQSPKTFRIIVIIAAGVVILAVGMLLVLWNFKTPDDSRKETGLTGDFPAPLPSPTGVVSEASPWSHSQTVLEKEPPVPTTKELDEAYRQVRNAIASRDLDETKLIVSSERIWHIENPKKLVGGLTEGGQYFEAIGESGEQNMVHTPYAIVFDAPPQDEIVPVKVVKQEPSERLNMILTNPKTGMSQLIRVTPWQYAYELQYKTKPGYADQGTGDVVFVWDTDKWVFQGQGWNLTYSENPGQKGDDVPPGKKVTTVTISDNGVCSPGEVTVEPGSAVQWSPITGMIYTISSSGSHWDSGYLYKDTYTKVFSDRGNYTYIVQLPPREPSEYTECSVRVL